MGKNPSECLIKAFGKEGRTPLDESITLLEHRQSLGGGGGEIAGKGRNNKKTMVSRECSKKKKNQIFFF